MFLDFLLVLTSDPSGHSLWKLFKPRLVLPHSQASVPVCHSQRLPGHAGVQARRRSQAHSERHSGWAHSALSLLPQGPRAFRSLSNELCSPPRAETQRRGGQHDPRSASVHPLHVHPPRRLPERRSQAQVPDERAYRRGQKGHLGEARSGSVGLLLESLAGKIKSDL